jgi:hypothetical protein
MCICVSCVVFALGILWRHRGNVYIHIRIADYLTEVYLKRRIAIWEKQALSRLMNLLAVEDAMCGMRNMCCISYTITHQPALIVTFLLQQDVFLREQHGLLCVRILLPFHVQPVQGLHQETNSVYSFVDEWYARLYTPLSFCVVARHEGKSLCHGSLSLRHLINCIQVTAANILPGQMFFRPGLNLTSLWGVCSGGVRTLWKAVLIM